jgi:hypothetical protein
MAASQQKGFGKGGNSMKPREAISLGGEIINQIVATCGEDTMVALVLNSQGKGRFPSENFLKAAPFIREIGEDAHAAVSEATGNPRIASAIAPIVINACLTRMCVIDFRFSSGNQGLKSFYRRKGPPVNSTLAYLDAIMVATQDQMNRSVPQENPGQKISPKDLSIKLSKLEELAMRQQDSLANFLIADPHFRLLGSELDANLLNTLCKRSDTIRNGFRHEVVKLLETWDSAEAISRGENSIQLELTRICVAAEEAAGWQGVMFILTHITNDLEQAANTGATWANLLHGQGQAESLAHLRAVISKHQGTIEDLTAALKPAGKCPRVIPLISHLDEERYDPSVKAKLASPVVLSLTEIQVLSECLGEHSQDDKKLICSLLDHSGINAAELLRLVAIFPTGALAQFYRSLDIKLNDPSTVREASSRVFEAADFDSGQPDGLLDKVVRAIELDTALEISKHTGSMKIGDYFNPTNAWSPKQLNEHCDFVLGQAEMAMRLIVSTNALMSYGKKGKNKAETNEVPKIEIPEDSEPALDKSQASSLRGWQYDLVAAGVGKDEILRLGMRLESKGLRATLIRDLHSNHAWKFREFAQHVEQFGEAAFFEQILQTPSLFRHYAQKLGNAPKELTRILRQLEGLSDQELQEELGTWGALPESEQLSGSTNSSQDQSDKLTSPSKPLADYRRVYVFGGRLNGERLGRLRESFPDLNIIHADPDTRVAGREQAISKDDLVIWCTDYNSHHGVNDFDRIRGRCNSEGAELLYLQNSSSSGFGRLFEPSIA